MISRLIAAFTALCGLAASGSIYAGVEIDNAWGDGVLYEFEYTSSSPQAIFDGVDSIYEVAEISVEAEGAFRYADIGYTAGCGVDQDIVIYEDAFDPTDTSINRVRTFDDHGSIPLNAGTDYYIVSKPHNDVDQDFGTTALFFASEDGGVATGLAVADTANACTGLGKVYIVTFDGTEPVASFDGEDYQYYVVASFQSDGVRPPPAWYDYGYEEGEDFDLDTRAFYFEGDFNVGDDAFGTSDDSDDEPLPAGRYTLVITTYDDGGGVDGVGIRTPAVAMGGAAPATPVPLLPFGGVILLVMGVMMLVKKRTMRR